VAQFSVSEVAQFSTSLDSAGSLVRTTAELLIALLPEWRFSRLIDPDSGDAELVIRQAIDGTEDGMSH
jgi:hypothetical protein